MTLSLIGLMVCAVLLGLGRLLGAPLLVGTVASVAFGSTAVATLDAAGGSSPLIYVVFAVLVCASAAASPAFGRNLSLVFVRSWEPWIVGALAVYAVGTAIILPRLFAGATSAFVTVRGIGVVEVSLQPSSGNLTQTGYFALGALTFLSLSSMLARGHRLPALRSGFRAWAALVAVGGLIDLAGKMAGLGDVLAPIRRVSGALRAPIRKPRPSGPRRSPHWPSASPTGGRAGRGSAAAWPPSCWCCWSCPRRPRPMRGSRCWAPSW
jgi:hypothetical protein